MAGEWNAAYADLDANYPQLYGDPVTYQRAADFFAGHGDVEDWGCGAGAFRPFLAFDQHYRGIDGSLTPFADEVTDLANYRSDVPCILLRHVLEHCYEWATVLDNAVASFSERLCVVLFTPLVEMTEVLLVEPDYGDVPVIAFRVEDLTERLGELDWTIERVEDTASAYGFEHMLYVAR